MPYLFYTTCTFNLNIFSGFHKMRFICICEVHEEDVENFLFFFDQNNLILDKDILKLIFMAITLIMRVKGLNVLY